MFRERKKKAEKKKANEIEKNGQEKKKIYEVRGREMMI